MNCNGLLFVVANSSGSYCPANDGGCMLALCMLCSSACGASLNVVQHNTFTKCYSLYVYEVCKVFIIHCKQTVITPPKMTGLKDDRFVILN